MQTTTASRTPEVSSRGFPWSGVVVLALTLILAAVAARDIRSSYEREPIYPGPGVTQQKMLSDYFPDLKDGPGDTPVYVMEGEKPGGSILVLGGVHATEVAGMLAAVVLVEKATVEAGTLFVIPHSNESAFTAQPAEDAYLPRFEIETDWGSRWFRLGDRLTAPVHQWPDPEVYVHYPSGQIMSGSEARNLNRTFPGRPDGTLTEKVAYAITQLAIEEDVDVVIDLHEASVGYPVVNVIVASSNGLDIAAQASLYASLFHGMQIGVDRSPDGLRGFTHREFPELGDTYAFLMETPNPLMDWTRGPTTEALLVEGKDPFLVELSKRGRLYVPFGPDGYPIDLRVARHLTGFSLLADAHGTMNPERAVKVQGIPTYQEIVTNGLGAYLNAPSSR